MRQLEVDAEARAFDALGMIEEEFIGRRSLGRARDIEIESRGRDALHIAPAARRLEAEPQPVAGLGHDLGLADLDPASREGRAARMAHDDLGLGKAQLVHRRMRLAIAAHCRVAEGQRAAGLRPREALQRVGAVRGKEQRLARDVGDVGAAGRVGRGDVDEVVCRLPRADRGVDMRAQGARPARLAQGGKLRPSTRRSRVCDGNNRASVAGR